MGKFIFTTRLKWYQGLFNIFRPKQKKKQAEKRIATIDSEQCCTFSGSFTRTGEN